VALISLEVLIMEPLRGLKSGGFPSAVVATSINAPPEIEPLRELTDELAFDSLPSPSMDVVELSGAVEGNTWR